MSKLSQVRPSQAEVADYQVDLTEEKQDLTLFAKRKPWTNDQEASKTAFAERNLPNYDLLDRRS